MLVVLSTRHQHRGDPAIHSCRMLFLSLHRSTDVLEQIGITSVAMVARVDDDDVDGDVNGDSYTCVHAGTHTSRHRESELPKTIS